MIFTILDEEGLYPEDEVQINTLEELRAFAKGGTGKIEIGWDEIDYDGEMIKTPVISSIEYLQRTNVSSQ